MDEFSPAKILPRDSRYCRTHAFAATLFAAHPWHRSNARTWAFVAEAWTDLAELKDRVRRIPATTYSRPE